MSRARFLLRPRWLVSHLLVVALVVLMVNLGFWQLRRLDQKRDHNALVEARTEQPAVSIDELAGPGDGEGAVDEARFRRAVAEGRYDPGGTVVVRNRSQDGRPGAWLVTPLDLAGGDRVGIIRGFVPFAGDGSIPEPPPPEGEVTVEGLAMDPGRLGGTAERDLAGLLGAEGMVPALLQAEASTPPDAAPAPGDGTAGTGGRAGEASAPAGEAGLVAVPPPELSEGPHLSYAVQWFIFSTIGAIGYPLVLRRVVARRGKEAGDAVGPGEGPAAGPGDDGPGGPGGPAPGPDTSGPGAAGRDAGTGDRAGGGRAGRPGDDDVDRELEELLRESG